MTNEERILNILAEMQGDMQGMKSDMQGMKSDMQGMKAEIQGLRTDMQEMDDRLSGQILKINMKLENQIEPQIKLLAEGHQTIMEAITPKSRVDELEDDVNMLKMAFRQINMELQELKQAQ